MFAGGDRWERVADAFAQHLVESSEACESGVAGDVDRREVDFLVRTMNTPQIQPSETRPVVLVIDDSPDVHRLLRARLKSEEIELMSAGDGPEGLRLARERLPALILLDLDMPVMDGFEVLRTLKGDPALMSVPVIVVSGLQSTQDKVTAFELGAVDYVMKPFEFTELRVRLRSALKMHMLMQMLEQRAQLDGLTGLWNRAFFDQRVAEEVSRNHRSGRPLSIAMVDVDLFKSVNDTFGHSAGDSVLQGLAKLLRRECRTSDTPCRFGGEEFVLLMPDTGPEDAAALCDRIRVSLEQIVWPRHPERRVTASFGVAGSTTAAAGLAHPAWVEAADRNLYSSKKTGRNRVTASTLGGGNLNLPGLAA